MANDVVARVLRVCIIGCGVSGMVVAYILRQLCNQYKIPVVIIGFEAGRPVRERDRDSPVDAVAGAGGAGVYSDGKFSAPPAGTGFFENPALVSHEDAERAYAAVREILEAYGARGLPAHVERLGAARHMDGAWELKQYACAEIPLADRIRMVEDMMKAFDTVYYETPVDWDIRSPLVVQPRPRHANDRPEKHEFDHVVVATGRFGALALQRPVPLVARRVELGVRIVVPGIIMQDVEQLDPKWTARFGVLAHDGTEVPFEARTFCVCRNGETVETEYRAPDGREIHSVSGRSDTPGPTHSSNLAVNVRVCDPALAEKIARAIFAGTDRARLGEKHYVDVPYEKLTSAHLTPLFGDLVARALMHAVALFVREFVPAGPMRMTRVQAPTVEGLCWYPRLERDLAMAGTDRKVFVTGDLSGVFRGIVASMASGAHVAHCIAERARTVRDGRDGCLRFASLCMSRISVKYVTPNRATPQCAVACDGQLRQSLESIAPFDDWTSIIVWWGGSVMLRAERPGYIHDIELGDAGDVVEVAMSLPASQDAKTRAEELYRCRRKIAPDVAHAFCVQMRNICVPPANKL